jgi:serine/threonine-protein kinase
MSPSKSDDPSEARRLAAERSIELHGRGLVPLAEPDESERDAREAETRAPAYHERRAVLRPGAGARDRAAPAREGTSPGLHATDAVAFSERYEMLGLLGRGGMGEVRLCRDRVVGRELAMKVVHTHRVDSPHRWRFVREARVQGQLEHPAIVPLYDLGIDPEGRPYFTMRRVQGESLTAVLRGLASGDPLVRARYSLRRRLTLFSRICMCVEYAHSRGVVHRDLKPGNVMLGEFDEVYVLDWGLAKLVGEVAAPRPLADASNARPTREGAVLGTPGYMSPEQLRGRVDEVGPWSDVYSLGAILFELLALEPVHAQPRMQDKLISNLSLDGARPRSRSGDARIPEGLDVLCERALRLAPATRFQSAGGLSEVVERHLDSGL